MKENDGKLVIDLYFSVQCQISENDFPANWIPQRLWSITISRFKN